MKSLYDPAVALAFFKSAGKPEKFAQGATIFAENEKARALLLQRAKMYYVYDGEVNLVAKKKIIGSVKKGEVFGELAPLTHAPRSAAAVANTACRVIALDEREFQGALMNKPVFALMLMSVMVARVRQTIAALHAQGKLSVAGAWKEAAVFDRRQLADLVQGLTNDPQIFYERIGPGGVFGEAALVDQSTRLAGVQAETECALQPVGRAAFLELVKVSPLFAERMLSTLAGRLRLLTARLE